MKILIDDVGIYFTQKSKKWPNSLVISRPLEEGRYINIPVENIPALIESLNRLMSKMKEYSIIFKTKDKKEITIRGEELDWIIYKISTKPEITKSQTNLQEILNKRE